MQAVHRHTTVQQSAVPECLFLQDASGDALKSELLVELGIQLLVDCDCAEAMALCGGGREDSWK